MKQTNLDLNSRQKGAKRQTKPTKKNKVVARRKPATTPKEPETTEEQRQAARDMLNKQMVGREYAPVSHDTLSKSITYVTAGNGLFKVRKTPIGIFKQQLAEIEGENTGLPAMEEGVELAIQKLPFRYLIEALSFYRDINKKDKTEASVLFFYNNNNIELPDIPGIREEDGFITYTPVQTNSKTLSDFKDDEWVYWLRENTALLLETHSHNSMGAFFSGTDDANENNTQFYAVWGQVDKEIPQLAFRYVMGDKKVEVGPEVLFDWPMVHERVTTNIQIESTVSGDLDLLEYEEANELYEVEPEVTEEVTYIQGPFNQIEYPEDWMGQHSKSVPTYKKYGRSNYWSRGKGKKTGGANRAATTYGSGSRKTYGSEVDDFYDDYYDSYGGYYGYGREWDNGIDDIYPYEADLFSDGFEFDELDNLALYPSGEAKESEVSPELHTSIENHLNDIRTNYPGTYETFEE